VPLSSCSKSPTSSLLRLHDPEYVGTVVFETSRATRPTTWRLIPEDTNLSAVPLGEAQVLHLSTDSEPQFYTFAGK